MAQAFDELQLNEPPQLDPGCGFDLDAGLLRPQVARHHKALADERSCEAQQAVHKIEVHTVTMLERVIDRVHDVVSL
jgi:hypothetical protein